MSNPQAVVDIVEGSLMIIGYFFAPVLALLPAAKKLAEGLAGRRKQPVYHEIQSQFIEREENEHVE